MKKLMYFGAIAALVLVVSCTKENNVTTPEANGKIHLVVKAGFDESVTKTYLDGKTVKWHEADEIGIIDALLEASSSAADKKAAVQKFTISDLSADNTTATFEGDITPGLDKYYAAYPYDGSDFVSESEGYVRLGFMTNQTASAPGSFDKTFNSSIALLKNGVLNFKNLGGLLKFELMDDNVKSVTLKAKDNGTIGGVYYVTLDDNGNITQETLASGRSSMTLTPASGNTFAPGVYYFCLSARTYTGGVTLTCALSDGPNKTVGNSVDVVVQRSKITSVGQIHTAIETITPVTFPVIFPLGYPTSSPSAASEGYNYYANDGSTPPEWLKDWVQDAAWSSGKKNVNWTGVHGTWYCKTQQQAYMTWNWDSAIVGTGVAHFIESINNIGSNRRISTPGIKGIWTGDYFEFTLPVKNFVAGTTLKLSMPLFTNYGPVFWEVLYKDGDNWVSTATSNLPAYSGSTVTRNATWAVLYHSNATTDTSDNMYSVEMTFNNTISEGYIKIRVKCVDGSVFASGNNAVLENQTKPRNSSNTASATFYFYYLKDINNQAITIEEVNI